MLNLWSSLNVIGILLGLLIGSKYVTNKRFGKYREISGHLCPSAGFGTVVSLSGLVGQSDYPQIFF